MRVSARSNIPPFHAMEVLRIANELEAAGRDILHLEIGEPSRRAPARVLDAAQRALANEALGYTEALGTPALRERIARHYAAFYGIELEPRRIIVTMGSSGGFLFAFLSAFEHGDRVALANPCYPGYRNSLSALGVTPVILPSGPETRYQPTVELLQAQTEELAGLIIASPSNPAGTMIPDGELESIAGYCSDKAISLISDEVYHGITYGHKAQTALAFTNDVIVVNGFSKYYAMTGWRLGWMIVPDDMVSVVERLAQNIFVSPANLAQHAALVAFDCLDELDAEVERYARNRRILLDGLPAVGIAHLAPADGAFYVYADISELADDSQEFCQRMLVEIGVAATPGVDFDQMTGHRFVRFSFAGATADLEQAIERLGSWNALGRRTTP